MFAKKYNFHLTYLGTGCIFKFDEQHPYGDEQTGFKESDLPNFYGSSYSTVKVRTTHTTGVLASLLQLLVCWIFYCAGSSASGGSSAAVLLAYLVWVGRHLATS